MSRFFAALRLSSTTRRAHNAAMPPLRKLALTLLLVLTTAAMPFAEAIACIMHAPAALASGAHGHVSSAFAGHRMHSAPVAPPAGPMPVGQCLALLALPAPDPLVFAPPARDLFSSGPIPPAFSASLTAAPWVALLLRPALAATAPPPPERFLAALDDRLATTARRRI